MLHYDHPKLAVVIYGQGGRHANLHSCFLLYVDDHAEKGQPRRQVADADSARLDYPTGTVFSSLARIL